MVIEFLQDYVLQILVAIFALFAISRSWLRFKHSNESIGELLFWTFAWIGIIIIAFIPQVTSIFAKIFNIGRGIDVIIYLGLIFLFYSLFRVYSKIEKLDQDITALTRVIAMDEIVGITDHEDKSSKKAVSKKSKSSKKSKKKVSKKK